MAATSPLQTRRSRTSILLIGFVCSLVIFLSLALIYYDQPSFTVQTIGLLIVILSLVLVMSGGWREVVALLLLTVFISTASVVVVTRDMAPPLAFALPLLWLAAFAGAVMLLYRSTLKIGPEEYVLIQNQVNGQLRLLSEAVELPPIVGWEDVVARIPRWDLSAFFEIQQVPTRSAHRIPVVKVYVKYAIVDPLKLHKNQTNRAKLYQEISRDLGMERYEAMRQHRFWEIVAEKAVSSAARASVRAIVWSFGDPSNKERTPANSTETPKQAFDNREEWAKEAQDGVRSGLERNGLRLIGFRVTEVETPETMYSEETVRAQHQADWWATYRTTVVAKLYDTIQSRSVEQLQIEALRETMQRDLAGKTNLSAEEIKQIVDTAVSRSQEALCNRILARLNAQGNIPKEQLKDTIVQAVREAQVRDEQRIKEVIMQAIDEAEDRERITRLFKHGE